MLRKKVINGLALISLLAITAMVFQRLYAHGTVMMPPARAYQCYLEGPENPTSAACQAAFAIGGSQPFYDWYEINQLPGFFKHKELVADGELCSASKDKYKGLDLARNDWVATTISPDANGDYNFVYWGTAIHDSAYFTFYITKDSYDYSQPLKWSDLEQMPFCTIIEPVLQGDKYQLKCPLPPNKDGRRIIYNIWLRDDSDEAFYACSDVILQNTTGLPTATPIPSCTDTAAWDATINYRLAGEFVSHKGMIWRSKWGNKGQEPGSAFRAWKYQYDCSSAPAGPTPTIDPNLTPSPTPISTATPSLPICTAPVWDSTVAYVAGTTVSYGGNQWYQWKARFWTQGNEPGTGDLQWGPWEKLAPCSDPNAPTPMPTNTPTATATNTPTQTNTPLPNATLTFTPTATKTSTSTVIATNTPPPNATLTNTPTATATATNTLTAIRTPTAAVTTYRAYLSIVSR